MANHSGKQKVRIAGEGCTRAKSSSIATASVHFACLERRDLNIINGQIDLQPDFLSKNSFNLELAKCQAEKKRITKEMCISRESNADLIQLFLE
jgi:hypothetical protein